MKQMEQNRAETLKEHGLELVLADPEGNDLRIWTLSIHTSGIDSDCELGKELRRYAIPTISFEVWIPDDFPVAPPKLRVLKPCFSKGSFWVYGYGALCLETLSRSGWSAAMSLIALGVQVKFMMSSQPGTVAGPEATAGSSRSDRERAWGVFDGIEKTHKDWDTFRT
jgi:ubiquitin-protein ligase